MIKKFIIIAIMSCTYLGVALADDGNCFRADLAEGCIKKYTCSTDDTSTSRADCAMSASNNYFSYCMANPTLCNLSFGGGGAAGNSLDGSYQSGSNSSSLKTEEYLPPAPVVNSTPSTIKKKSSTSTWF